MRTPRPCVYRCALLIRPSALLSRRKFDEQWWRCRGRPCRAFGHWQLWRSKVDRQGFQWRRRHQLGAEKVAAHEEALVALLAWDVQRIERRSHGSAQEPHHSECRSRLRTPRSEGPRSFRIPGLNNNSIPGVPGGQKYSHQRPHPWHCDEQSLHIPLQFTGPHPCVL